MCYAGSTFCTHGSAGALVGAAAWLQSKAGFGPRIRSFGFFSTASMHGMWFVGAFGRWVGPLPSPAAALTLWRLSPARSMLRQLGHAAMKVPRAGMLDITMSRERHQLSRSGALPQGYMFPAINIFCGVFFNPLLALLPIHELHRAQSHETQPWNIAWRHCCRPHGIHAYLHLQDMVTVPHPLIVVMVMLLMLGFVCRRVLPARTVVQHLEVRCAPNPGNQAQYGTKVPASRCLRDTA